MNSNLRDRIARNLAAIEAAGLARNLASPRGIDLSSNDFLCLARDERIKAVFVEAIGREGVGSTGSRLLRGQRDVFREVEGKFADWKKTERALYFSSGYQANIGVLQTFLEEGDTVYSDELNHASLIDGIRLSKAKRVIFKHRDSHEVYKLLRETDFSGGQQFLVTESLFSMDGTIAPLGEYAAICRETGSNLIVDEAHAVGVFGKNGSGLIEEFGIETSVFLSINTAGKALGVAGAFVAGDDWAIEYLINRARSFIFSTAPPPALACALITSIEIARAEKERREKLLNSAQFFRDLLNENGIKVSRENSQIVPVAIGESRKAVEVAGNLWARGFDVRAVRPPTVPENTARLRVSLNVCLTEEMLRRFAENLTEVINKKSVSKI